MIPFLVAFVAVGYFLSAVTAISVQRSPRHRAAGNALQSSLRLARAGLQSSALPTGLAGQAHQGRRNIGYFMYKNIKDINRLQIGQSSVRHGSCTGGMNQVVEQETQKKLDAEQKDATANEGAGKEAHESIAGKGKHAEGAEKKFMGLGAAASYGANGKG